jgi:predicted outer membrane repeat protein
MQSRQFIVRLAILLLALLPATLGAKTIFVNHASDSSAIPFATWATAASNLQDAIALALDGDEIWVAQGTYYPDEGGSAVDNVRTSNFALKYDVALYGGFSGTGTETVISQANPAANPTILSGDLLQDDDPSIPATSNDNAYNVLTSYFVIAGTILDGFTITAGNANAASPRDKGGAIFNSNSSPTLRQCTFLNNQATYGGSIANLDFSSPSLINCSFQGNNATYGGALYNFNSSSPALTNCSFQGNNAASWGGALYNLNSSSPALTNCSFQGNRAYLGGAILNQTSSSPTLTNCILWNNDQFATAPPAAGDSVDNYSSTPTYSHCLVEHINLSGAGTGNFDGTNPANDPRFVLEGDPLTAPTTGGDLRLRSGSPAINAGDDAANLITTDIAGNPRKSGTIDLGAYEGRLIFVDHTAAPPNNGSSWADAFTILQNALALADPGDEIWVAQGTYHPDEGSGQSNDVRTSTFALQNGVKIYGGYPNGGGPRNLAAYPTILSGDIDQNDGPDLANITGNAYHVLTALSISSSAILDGFTIIAGNANGASSTINSGGAIYNSYSSLSLNNCSFQGNNAALNGGAIYNGSSYPSLKNCSFQGNKASSGGAIYNSRSSPSLSNCSFHGNNATVQGGAIYNSSSSSPSLKNCILWNNAQAGNTTLAGASIASVNTSSVPTYSHCLVENINLSGTGNFDGTDPANDPRFVLETDPLTASTNGGDLRLRPGSPAIDAGDDAANLTTTDLAGNPRKFGTIDLGAHEQEVLYVDDTAVGSNNGSSWTNAFQNLQDALAAATSSQAIQVAEGTYFPDQGGTAVDNVRTETFNLIDGVLLYGGYPNGGGRRNPAANPTILSGDIDKNDGSGFANITGNAYHVLTANSISSSAILDGFTITAGNANSASLPNDRGGAIYNYISSPALNNCSFQGNNATFGGAVFNYTSSPTLNNCSFQGNKANYAGAIYNYVSSSPFLNNCSFQGNNATFGGAVYNSVSSSPTLKNCILWNNAEAGDSTLAGASVFPPSTTTYSHCLVENIDLSSTGTGNFDGTNPANDPRFVLETDPLTAPTNGGDLRLLAGSPAINTGDNTANLTTTDLAGNSRKHDTIDLGAYEQQGVTFSLLHPGLDPDGDENGNGLSNFLDYASGQHPEATGLLPIVEITATTLTLRTRVDGSSTFPFAEYSDDLDNWFTLVEGVHYQVVGNTVNGPMRTLTLEFLPGQPAKRFFRQGF